MFIDSRTVPDGAVITADLCIIGAGAAGISIARELDGKRISVALLESGGFTADPATQSLYTGENVGIPYLPLEATRSRFLGGSTNCWVGWCRPFDPIDFRQRAWVPNSGWPIAHQALQPYFDRAHDVLQLGSLEFDAESWRDRLAGAGLDFLPLREGAFRNQINLFSPPTRFGEAYRQLLQGSGNIRAYLHANVAEIVTSGDAGSVERVQVATLAGNRLAVTAKTFILASGGIENARLLLLSNRVEPRGLGNRHDMVGRYFMEHPRLRGGRVRLRDPRRHRRLYDSTLVMSRRRLNTRELRIGMDIAPTEEAQARYGLQNSRTYLSAIYRGDDSPELAILKRGYEIVKDRRKYGYGPLELPRHIRRNLPALIGRSPQLAASVYDYVVNPNHAGREFWLDTIIEPTPNPDSRVTLADDRDLLGLNRARLELRLTEGDRHTFVETQRLLRGDLEAAGAVLPQPESNEPEWPDELFWCSHHMGTTRMDPDPRRGVVDENCRVHDVENLYIAGSSVFPTGGSDIPTMTIVALALRLSDHVQASLGGTAA